MKDKPVMKVCQVDVKKLWLSSKEAKKYLGVGRTGLKTDAMRESFITL